MPTTATPTDRQYSYLRKLEAEVGAECYLEAQRAVFGFNYFTNSVDVPSVVSRTQMSSLISLLAKSAGHETGRRDYNRGHRGSYRRPVERSTWHAPDIDLANGY